MSREGLSELICSLRAAAHGSNRGGRPVSLRRSGFVLLSVALSLALSGCILFDAERRKNFRGPSWDLPISFSVAAPQEVLLRDLLSVAPDDNGEYSFKYPLAEYVVFAADEKAVVDFGAIPSGERHAVSEIEIEFLQLPKDVYFTTALLVFDVRNDVPVKGQADVSIYGLRDGIVVGSASQRFDLEDAAATGQDIAFLLNERPDTLRLEWSIAFEPATVIVQPGDRISVDTQLRIPLGFQVPAGGAALDLAVVELVIDDAARDALRRAPITDITFYVDLESRMPLPLEMTLLFGNEPDPSRDPSRAKLVFHVPAGAEHPVKAVVPLTIDEVLRSVLVGEKVFVAPRLSIPNGEEPYRITLSKDHGMKFRVYATVTFAINK